MKLKNLFIGTKIVLINPYRVRIRELKFLEFFSTSLIFKLIYQEKLSNNKEIDSENFFNCVF